MYIARDRNGALWMYDKEPVKKPVLGMWASVDGHMFPVNGIGEINEICKNVKWKDEKAIEVEIIIKRR